MTLGPPAWSPQATLAEVRKGRTRESSRPSPTSAFTSMVTAISSYSRGEGVSELDRYEAHRRARGPLSKKGKIRVYDRRNASISPRDWTVWSQHDWHSVACDLDSGERSPLRRDIRGSRQGDRFPIQPHSPPVAGSRDPICRREKRGDALPGEGNVPRVKHDPYHGCFGL